MLRNIIDNNKFTLLVSLPANKIEYATAALESGADGVKVHLNVHHYASNNTYGSFEEERTFLEDLSREVKKYDKIFGLVPGEGNKYASTDELEKLNQLGADFLSSYVEYAPAELLLNKKFDILGALSSTTDIKPDYLNEVNTDILECSIVPQEKYRTQLTIYDLAKYSNVVKNTNKPVLIPTQKKIKPEEIVLLHDIGCKAIMLGAVVFEDRNIDTYKRVISEFRKNIDSL
ncbi:hypothetical protein [Anaerococcus provencensis]|uniref:hypothetical protein n=1 Tax=Anaerococcus provencensis TaxID=938293 RepID=UPI000310F8DA|nr:hypothetical protein [Anaerococcus provencensis]